MANNKEKLWRCGMCDSPDITILRDAPINGGSVDPMPLHTEGFDEHDINNSNCNGCGQLYCCPDFKTERINDD